MSPLSSEKGGHLTASPLIKYGGLNGNALLYGIVAIATTGFSLFGYDQGLMSGIIASKQFNAEFPATYQANPRDVHAGTIQGTVVSTYEVGCFFGALAAFFIGERLGRRRMMLTGGIIMVIGTILSVTSFGPGDPRGNVGGFVQFIISRVVTGFGNGMNTATIPSWVAESSKAHNRGFLICLEASTVAVGTVIAYWLDFGLSFVNSSVSWRFPIAFQIFFALILMAGVLVLPESPRWLIAHGHDDEGMRVLAALSGSHIEDPVIVLEKNRIADAVAAQTSTKGKGEILKGGKNQHLRRALVGASTQLFQQLGGCNAVIYYATILFENQIGLETQLSLILGGVLAIVYACFALTSFLLVERVGRRKLFLIGTVGQAVSMFITFGCLVSKNAAAARGGAFGLYLFIAFFGATWLPLPWLYPAELNSMAVRTQANAISTCTNWISNFLVVQVLPTMTASIDAYTFLLFGLANIIFLPFIYFFYPETAGRALEEIDILYAHAHIIKRRATLVAEELPKLNPHQVSVLTERYDIHAADVDQANVEAGNGGTYGAAPNSGLTEGVVDTSIPPAEPDEKVRRERAGSNEELVNGSGTSTRVGSIDAPRATQPKTTV